MKKLLLAFLGVACFAHVVYATTKDWKLTVRDAIGDLTGTITVNSTNGHPGDGNYSAFYDAVTTAVNKGKFSTDVDHDAFCLYGCAAGEVNDSKSEILVNWGFKGTKAAYAPGSRFSTKARCEKWIRDQGMNADYAKCGSGTTFDCSDYAMMDGSYAGGLSCIGWKGTEAESHAGVSRFVTCLQPYYFYAPKSGGSYDYTQQSGSYYYNCVVDFKAKFKDAYGWLENHPSSIPFDKVTNKKLSERAAELSQYPEGVTCTSDDDYTNPTIVCSADKGYFWDMPRCENYRKAHMEEDDNYKKECVFLCEGEGFGCIATKPAPYKLQETKNSRLNNCATGLKAIGSIGCKK